ncbi:MAG: ABC transporter substrate-binding protein, partial [Bacteroidales bacterium]|nr:ABC transporter substrate-binding protein [Bacteroidales bacterium]
TLQEVNPETVEQKINGSELDTTRKIFNNPPKSTLNVALMLPLYLSEVDQIRINPRGSNTRTVVRPFSFISFYEGAALAAQAFEDEKVKINVHVFDIAEDANAAVRLINSGRLNDVDIIIGPLFARSFEVMSDFAKQREIFIINPFSERDDILIDNPYVIKINPSERIQLQSLLNYVVKDNVEQKIVIVSNDSLPNEKERTEQTKLFFETHCEHLETPVFFDISKERFQTLNNRLSGIKPNAIIYLSNSQAFATEILTQVSRRESLSGNTLYCLHKLPQLELMELQFLNDLQTHYATSLFVEYTNEQVKNFDRLFFETYQTIPTIPDATPHNNAYVGYDVMSYVLQLLKIGNTNYGNILETMPYKGFHNTIRLERSNPLQGLENKNVNILKIENSRLKRVNN